MGYSIKFAGLIKQLIDITPHKRPDFKKLAKILNIPNVFKPVSKDNDSLMLKL
jgi:hypothetical protein